MVWRRAKASAIRHICAELLLERARHIQLSRPQPRSPYRQRFACLRNRPGGSQGRCAIALSRSGRSSRIRGAPAVIWRSQLHRRKVIGPLRHSLFHGSLRFPQRPGLGAGAEAAGPLRFDGGLRAVGMGGKTGSYCAAPISRRAGVSSGGEEKLAVDCCAIRDSGCCSPPASGSDQDFIWNGGQ